MQFRTSNQPAVYLGRLGFARSTAPVALALVASLLAACGGDRAPGASDSTARADTSAASAAASGPTTACAGDNAGLTLSSGFCAGIFADSINHARHIAVASNGDVYVTMEGTQPSPEKAVAGEKTAPPRASFVAMRDTNRDGRADIIQRVGSLGNTGVAIANGFVYVDEGAQIVRYTRADSQLVPTKREVVVSGIPMQTGHRARNIAIGADSALYVNVGSATNSCQQKDRESESPGVDPCVELETRGGIWKFDARRTGQKFSKSARYATGIRNGMGIAFGPDGRMYATQHGRDQLHDNWPKVFPAVNYQAENPGEELMQVNEGDDFGWPYCYYAMDVKGMIDAPEYGGDGKANTRCSAVKNPVAAYPGHWAPMSLVFYGANGAGAFPARYSGGAFIAFHGSWNRAPEPQAGYRVVYQPMANGAVSGAYETFADGFSELAPDKVQPDRAKHRPTGLAVGPDGALFITDDMGGRIYRVTYGSGAK